MRQKIILSCLALALVSAIAYILMGVGVLHAGDVATGEVQPGAFYIIPGGYILGGVLVLAKRRWLWITGTILNAFAIGMFFGMYAAKPDVMLSVPGLTTKITQVLLEAGLVYLIITHRRERAPEVT